MTSRQLSVAYVSTGNPATVLDTVNQYPGQLGGIITVNEGTAAAPNLVDYQYVQLKSGVTFAVGELVVWDDRTIKQVTNVLTNLGAAAGIIRQAVVAAASNWAWIAKCGLVPVKYLDAPTSACDATGKACVTQAATAGRADCVVAAITTQLQIGNCVGAQDGGTKLANTLLYIPDMGN